MSFEGFFRWLDSELPKISPFRDPLLLRLVLAVIPVVFFAIDALYDMPFFYGLALPFYWLCLALYALGLLRSVAILHQVSAELLIVLVMIVTLIDGKPLSGALVAWFIGLGLYVSFTIIRKNREKIEGLIKQTKTTALLMVGSEIREVPTHTVQKDDVLIVPKGSVVPVDGIIIEGRSSFDESSISGEPFPIHRIPGDDILSGTFNLSAPIQIKATKSGDDSFISVITAEIEKTLQYKSTLQKRADAIVQYLLLGVSGYSFLLLFVSGSLDLMATALSVLCPCAWALATPTAFASGIGRSARLNILVRGGEPLETMHEVKTVILDKTGTVTLAVPEVHQIVAMKTTEAELLEIAASLESRFTSPVARSIVNYCKDLGITRLRPVRDAEDLPGRGVRGRLDHCEILIGSPETLEMQGIQLPEIKYVGRTIGLAKDGELMGMVIIRDVVQTAMENLAASIRSFGVERVVLATGDHEESEAKRVAALIGADGYHFNCRPEDKAALVRQWQSFGKVAMIGDGVNDAPALAAADVGIAIGGHKNIGLSIASSDMVILGEDANDLIQILQISRKMRQIIKQNYTWAISFNGVGLTLATFGLLNPVLAAFLHHISSVLVVANAARLYLGRWEIVPRQYIEPIVLTLRGSRLWRTVTKISSNAQQPAVSLGGENTD
ncbi:cation-translocating P-type ATPase [Methylococcus sp. ANG]|uniref:heavy metal translocating P-type ATPase n=1 Tax=unclassified Methylococcus TaxID=2618889 RepID=UPI001C52CFD0|nr:cation-translocating P-type ATPase [Methylococcus sp. Mc7]QXP85219.1 cadmium-translocating P-type ATPase [Methylococcus sp. Mc7]